MRAKVVNDGRAAVEQRLDVDDFPGPVRLVEDALAEGKMIDARFWPLAGNARGRLGRQHAIRVTPRRPSLELAVALGPVRALGRPACLRHGRPIDGEQDLAQLHASVRLEHHELTAFQRRFVSGQRRKAARRDS